MIPGGHLTQKLLTKVSSLFVTNEHSQIPSARASRSGSEEDEMNGQHCSFFARYSSKYQPQPRLVGLLQHGYRLEFNILQKLSKIPLNLSEFHNKNKHGALHKVVQVLLSRR